MGDLPSLIGIAGAAQFGRNLFGLDLFPNLDGVRNGVNPG